MKRKGPYTRKEHRRGTTEGVSEPSKPAESIVDFEDGLRKCLNTYQRMERDLTAAMLQIEKLREDIRFVGHMISVYRTLVQEERAVEIIREVNAALKAKALQEGTTK